MNLGIWGNMVQADTEIDDFFVLGAILIE